MGDQWYSGARLIDAAIGIEPGRREATRAAFEALFADTPGGATRRAILAEVMGIQRIGPQAHDMEIGYRYDVGAIAPDGTPPTRRDPMASVHNPDTRPGSRLPHAWIEQAGRRVSTHDLLGVGRFVLFVGAGASQWEHAPASISASRGTTIVVIPIDTADGWRDINGTWAKVRGVSVDGAVLVRPDGHVGWRTAQAPVDRMRAIGEALGTVLGPI